MTRDEESLELLQSYRNGDKTALTRLTELHTSFVHWAANKYGAGVLDHDDAVNDAWLGFLESVELFDLSLKKSFIGFVGPRVIGRVVRSLGRELTRRGEPSGQTVVEEPTIDSPDEVYWVREALAELPLRERQIVEGLYLRDEDKNTVAKSLGISRQRVQQIEARALNKLREVLA